MEATRFEALSIQDAIKQVKQELGKDAVIISTKQTQRTLEDKRVQKFYEVLATPAVTKKSISSSSEPNIRKPDFPRIRTKDAPTLVRGSSTITPVQTLKNRERNTQFEKSKDSDRSPTSGQSNTGKSVIESSQEVLNLGNNLFSNLEGLRKEIRKLPHFDFGEQLQEVKILLHEVLRANSAEISRKSLNPTIDDICLKLRVSGVSPSIITDLQSQLERIATQDLNSENKEDALLSASIKYILKHLKVNPTVFLNDGNQGIHCFLGSSGVGKTSALAKIAANLKLKNNLRVCLVNLDTQKVGSTEQLMIYSKILGLDFKSADSSEQMEETLNQSYKFDSILVDTMGQSANSKSQLQLVNRLNESGIPYKFHLVISSTTKQRDIEESLRAYKHLDLSSLIFSKLDESWSYGEMLNTSAMFGIPMSFFTTGPNIPEDLEPATKERVIERILKI